MNTSFKKTLLSLARKSAIAAVALGFVATNSAAETWRLPTFGDSENQITKNITQFAEDVGKLTNGELTITVHPAGSLIKPANVWRAIRTGQVPVGDWLPILHGNKQPIYDVATIPFVAPSWEQNKGLKNAMLPVMKRIMAEDEMVYLFSSPWTPLVLYSKKPIRSMADLEGLAFRAQSPIYAQIAQRLKANPVTVDQSEISQAFSSGVIDVMFTSSATGVDNQVWDYVSYISELNAAIGFNLITANKKQFDALDENVRNAILQAAAQADERGWKDGEENAKANLQKFKEMGITVESPSPEFLRDWNEVRDELLRAWIAKVGADGEEILKTIGLESYR